MKKIKIISILVLVALILGVCTISYADMQSSTVSGLTVNQSSTADKIGGRVLKVAQIVCFTAAVILLMWMGIKWLTSAPEGKAELKKGLIIALIAVIILVSAGTIIGFVSSGTKDVFGGTSGTQPASTTQTSGGASGGASVTPANPDSGQQQTTMNPNLQN